ncbi:MAG TPA: acyl-CoA dehydrogenase family protein [Actinomycetales bacterium]|nr:acyl-CoA dehydrogenase family protein [Actinomycetales bacterium]
MSDAVAPLDLLALDGLLTQDEKDVRASVRAMVDEHVRPYVAQWFEEGTLPARDLAREFGRLGVLGMHLEGYGCAGMNATSYGVAAMEIEAADSGVRSMVSVQGSLAMYAIHAFGSEEQRQQWLPPMAAGEAIGCFGLTEPDHGSDPSGMRTRARRDGSDWVLDGTKMWITNGSVADVAIVWATTDDGVRGFVVPTSARGFSARSVEHKLSMRASVTSELVLDGVRLPEDAVLPGVRGLRGPLACLTEARFGIVWGVLGSARDCLQTAISYAGERVQFGRPIAGFQLTQRKLVDMALELDKAFLLAHHLGRAKEAGTATPVMVSAAKLNNVREALAIARECRTILGANGISLEYPVLRHANNLESVLTYEGTSEVHTLVLGQALTGIDAFRG